MKSGEHYTTTLDSSFCISALEEAIATHGRPEIFNTDQGAQYTDREFMKVLKNHDIRISMDGRGRVLDNIFVERLGGPSSTRKCT